jgi:hypothetical protein
MFQYFGQQFLTAFYQWTSFQVGSFNFADMALNFQSAFLDSSFVYVLQLIIAFITIILGVATAWLFLKRKELDHQLDIPMPMAEAGAGTGPIQQQWDDIIKHVDSIHEGEWKFAVIEADTLVEQVLGKYFPGDTMGERLMNIDKTKLLSIDGLWEAHKMRNRLTHDANYFLRHAEAMRAIKLFEATLKELGVII